MKKLFTFFAMLTCMVVTYAQSPLVATLNHNDTISVYYGIDALSSAYSAAVNGDVITLSSGGFSAPSKIAKIITIRGAGMETDSVNKVAPTILTGDFHVYSPQATSSTWHLTIEGIHHDGKIYYGYRGGTYDYFDLTNAQFIKCRLNEFVCSSTVTNYISVDIEGVKFIQCKIKNITALGNATFLNCYVGAPGCAYTGSTTYKMSYECFNCVVYGSLHPSHVNNSLFVNSVLIGGNPLDKTNMAYNCIGVYTANSDTVNHVFSNLPDNLSNVCYRKVGEVFDTKTFDANGTDNYSDADTYQLLESIRTKHLGTDGTEIGMYGGALPYTPLSALPRIKKFNVAPQSDGEGKLKVEIEVSAAGK